MTRLQRAFVAVYPPAELVTALEARLGDVRGTEGMRWSAPDTWHVTLRFLGPVADGGSDAVWRARLRDALRAMDWRPVARNVRLAGAGAFPSARRGSVLWVGVDDRNGALRGLADVVDEACTIAGSAVDARELRPHLTVARSPRARDLRPLVGALEAALGGVLLPEWHVDEVRLMDSDTRLPGAVHELVERFPLGV